MDGKPVPGSERRDQKDVQRKKRRSAGLEPTERNGYWHIHGRLKLPGGSVRVRQATGLVATQENYAEADAIRFKIEQELRNEAIHGRKPSLGVAAAAYRYLNQPRQRPIGASTVRILKEVGERFGQRQMDEIRPEEWIAWVEKRQAGNKSETRERFISAIMAFLNYCAGKSRGWVSTLPEFDRDANARNPMKRARRRVQDLRPELIRFLISHASPHLKGQLAVHWSTGARVSSILYGCRVCDLIIGGERSQISFDKTKNTDTVVAALHPYAVELLKEYLEWRGNLHEREQPLFLTHLRKPYADNGGDGGGQTSSAFGSMKRRAVEALLESATKAAEELLDQGDKDSAKELVAAAEADAALLKQVTPHWFRHLLATKMLQSTGADYGTTGKQGGWRDWRSMMGYQIDVPEHRQSVVNALDFGDENAGSVDTLWTRSTNNKSNS